MTDSFLVCDVAVFIEAKLFPFSIQQGRNFFKTYAVEQLKRFGKMIDNIIGVMSIRTYRNRNIFLV